jgi:hypothetical protein
MNTIDCGVTPYRFIFTYILEEFLAPVCMVQAVEDDTNAVFKLLKYLQWRQQAQ